MPSRVPRRWALALLVALLVAAAQACDPDAEVFGPIPPCRSVDGGGGDCTAPGDPCPDGGGDAGCPVPVPLDATPD